MSDSAPCVSPVVAGYMRGINDRMFDNATRDKYLKQLILKIVDTAGSPDLERRRAYRLADSTIRQMAPIALDAEGLATEAQELRNLDPITDKKTAMDACYTAKAVEDSAYVVFAARRSAYAVSMHYVADTFSAPSEADTVFAAARTAEAAACTAISAPDVDVWQMCVDLVIELCEMKD